MDACGFHKENDFNWTFVGLDNWFFKRTKKKLTDIGFFCFGLLKDWIGFSFWISDFGFLDTGRLILYQSTSASKVADSAVANNSKTTLFLIYGFYSGSRRITDKGSIEVFREIKKAG